MNSDIHLHYSEIISIIKKLPHSRLKKLKAVIDDELSIENSKEVDFFLKRLDKLKSVDPFKKLADPLEWQHEVRNEW